MSDISDKRVKKIFQKLENNDSRFLEMVSPFLEGLYQYYFRVDIQGWENVPEKPSLFVGNHNGLLTYEVLMVFYAWYKKYGVSRKAVGLAHGIAVDNPLLSWLLPRLGAVPAHPKVAHQAFEKNFSVLVYPGGEKEAWRPSAEKKKIEFFQRKGFIRLALRERVPIVPIVSIGAHETYMIFSRGDELAEKLGLRKKLRMHGLPVTPSTIFLMWCLSTGMLTFFPLLLAPFALASVLAPLPAKMSFRILPAVDVCSMVVPNLSEEENLQIIYDHVTSVMQKVLSEEYEKRKWPVIG